MAPSKNQTSDHGDATRQLTTTHRNDGEDVTLACIDSVHLIATSYQRRILFVDDEPEIQHIFQRRFQDQYLPAASWLLGVAVLCLAGGRLIFPKRRYPPANISLIVPEGR
jgi:hypothetical protein